MMGSLRLWEDAGTTLLMSVRFGPPVTALALHHRASAIGLGRAVAYLLVTDTLENERDANIRRLPPRPRDTAVQPLHPLG